MKVYKDRQHSLMLKPFGMLGKQYCGVTVFTFFDLAAPADLLKEQELWQTVPDQMQHGNVLDMGMPKPNAEFLVYGSCFAPKNTARNASKVTVLVGECKKTLYVFGERFWSLTGTITDPLPFTEVPLTYALAYGGPDYAPNPQGKGYKTVACSPSGQQLRTLPQIEHPKELIGSLGVNPQPACFEPLDITWPQRAKKTGTFDDGWLKTRWPDMPDDADPTFFNTGAPSQWQQGWYTGGEPIEITNMNPDMPVIQSRLPEKRIRVFLTMFKNFDRFKKPEEMEMDFKEVSMHIDTVSLFPTVMRGVVHYRGTVENADDEYYDIVRVFVATEDLKDEPKDIEYYRDEQLKRLERGADIDMSKFEKSGKKLSRLALKVKKIPKEIERLSNKIMGNAPVMPRSPEELAEMAKGNLAKSLATVDKLEGVALGLHSRFGHQAAIDLTRFDKFRGKLGKMGDKLASCGEKTTAAAKKVEAAKSRIVASVEKTTKDIYSPDLLKALEVPQEKIDELGLPVGGYKFPEGTGNPFHDRGFPIVVAARKGLEKDSETMDRLRRLGLERDTIKNAWLGVLPAAIDEKKSYWGLEAPEAEDPFSIPAGLVMPRFDKARLNRFMVRTNPADEYAAPGLEYVSPGSNQEPLALFPSAEQAHWVRAADELQALYVEQEIGDCCGVVSLATQDSKPGKEAAPEIEAAGVFVCILPEGTTPDSPEWSKWQRKFANAKLLALPKGTTVFECALGGYEIRKLIMDLLPPEFASAHSIDFEIPDKPEGSVGIPKLAFPDMDIKATVQGLMAQKKAKFAPMVERLTAKREEALSDVSKMLKEAGDTSTPEQIAAEADKQTASELADQIKQHIAIQQNHLEAQGLLKPEHLANIEKANASLTEAGSKMDALEAQGKSMIAAVDGRVAEAKSMAASKMIPGLSLEEMKAKGLDPEKGMPLTREQVIKLLERGESLAGRNYTGADLSELDLSGADLRKAILIKTKLVKAKLDNAVLDKSIIREADLSEASLAGASMRLTAVLKSKLKKADLKNTNLDKVTLTDCDLDEADLSGASMRLTSISKCALSKANLCDAGGRLIVIQKSGLQETLLHNANLNKGMLKDCVLDKADFSGATINRVMFRRSRGEQVCFSGTDMSHGRMAGNSEFPGADFRNAKLEAASFRESNFSGSDFTGASLKGSLIELCDLSLCKLRLVPARRARILKTNLEQADMAGMNLMLSSLRKSRLVSTDLTAANLYCVDFYKCVMHKTKLDRANLKRSLLYNREDLLS